MVLQMACWQVQSQMAKLAGSIGNSLLSNSAITIDGTSVSLGGSISTNNTQLTTEQVKILLVAC